MRGRAVASCRRRLVKHSLVFVQQPYPPSRRWPHSRRRKSISRGILWLRLTCQSCVSPSALRWKLLLVFQPSATRLRLSAVTFLDPSRRKRLRAVKRSRMDLADPGTRRSSKKSVHNLRGDEKKKRAGVFVHVREHVCLCLSDHTSLNFPTVG